MAWFDSTFALVVAGITSYTAVLIGIFQIIQHLRYYSQPVFQRYIVRIIFLVPMYSLASFPSLLSEENAIYITTFRDCYEAWVIYNFMSLCLAYVGGPGAVEVKMNGFVLLPSWLHWTCCLPPMPVNGRFVALTKRGALQFVFVKPILAILTVVLYATGHYVEGDWAASNSYLYITIAYNITYTIALYALLLFYLGTHDLLAPFKPLLKFILVKSVIFMTYWQGLIISILIGVGVVSDAKSGTDIQNFLICLEMLPAAICMLFAFPHTEYAASGGAGGGLTGGNVSHAISIRDVFSDTLHHFAPTYTEYVLYSDGATKTGISGGAAATPLANNSNIDQADLLSNVELGTASDWNANPFALDADEEPQHMVVGTRYVARERGNDDDADDSSQAQNRSPVTSAANPFQFENITI